MITRVEDVAGKRIGVQKGTVYEDWLQTKLVEPGLVSATQIFLYGDAEQAVKDLQRGRIDLFLLDKQPAETFVEQGGVKIVAQDLNPQKFAIAVPSGSDSLRRVLNQALAELQSDGAVADLLQQYLNIDAEDIIPVPTPAPEQPTPTPSASTPPTATPPPAKCVDGMAWVADLTYDDNNMQSPPSIPPGQPFVKAWRIRNSGTCTWDSAYKLTYVQGNVPEARMGGQPTPIKGTVAPGSNYDMEVNLVAPTKPGTYQGWWQMVNAQGVAFGERIYVGITVPASATPTPRPTQTPSPNISFTVDRTSIKAGECVTFSWNVQNVKAVYFYADGESWQQNGVAGTGSSVECPPQTTTYYLRVVNPDDSVEVRQITIQVEPVVGAPTITRFTVDPPSQITVGQCVNIQWQVEGAVDRVLIARNNAPIWDGAPFTGNMQDCPPGTGTIAYTIEASGAGGVSRQQHNINVVSAATATPVPTPVPDAPVIYGFTAEPAQIQVNECTKLSWSAGGGAERTRLLRDGVVLLDNAPVNGWTQDCLSQAGTFAYRLEASNRSGQTVASEQTVTVSSSGSALTGKTWQLVSYFDGASAQVSVLNGTEITAIFGADSMVSGSAGCNTYEASYQSTSNTLSFGAASATSMFCETPEGIMQQEGMYLAVLPTAATYQISSSQLQDLQCWRSAYSFLSGRAISPTASFALSTTHEEKNQYEPSFPYQLVAGLLCPPGDCPPGCGLRSARSGLHDTRQRLNRSA